MTERKVCFKCNIAKKDAKPTQDFISERLSKDVINLCSRCYRKEMSKDHKETVVKQPCTSDVCSVKKKKITMLHVLFAFVYLYIKSIPRKILTTLLTFAEIIRMWFRI